MALLGGTPLEGGFVGTEAAFSVFACVTVQELSDGSELRAMRNIPFVSGADFSSSEESSQSLFVSTAGAGVPSVFSSSLSASQSSLTSEGFSSGVGGDGSGSGERAFVVKDGVDTGVDSFVEVPV